MAPHNSRIPNAGGKFPAADYNSRTIQRRHHTTGRQPGPQDVPPRDRQVEAEEILRSPGAARAAAAAEAAAMEDAAANRRGYVPSDGARKAAQAQRGPFESAAARGTKQALQQAKASLVDDDEQEGEERDNAFNEIRLELTQRFIQDPEFTGGYVLAGIETILDMAASGHLRALDVLKACVKEIRLLSVDLARQVNPDEAEKIACAIADYANALVMINKLWTESDEPDYRLA